MNNQFLNNMYYFLIFVLVLSSCGGGGGSNSGSVTPIPNAAPLISGSISEIRVGELMNFQPVASDQNSDPLTFSVTGSPEWTNFDTNSGLLSGTPDSDELGSSYSISISVSDGLKFSIDEPLKLVSFTDLAQ